MVEPDKLEVVASFYYLSDMFSVGRGCAVAVSTHYQTAFKTFREPLSVLTFRHPLKSPLGMCKTLTHGAPSSMAVQVGC